MSKTLIILTFLTIGFSLLNVSPSIASGTENPNAGSVREDESDNEIDEKLEERRESRRERRRQKRKKALLKNKSVQEQNRKLKEDEPENEEEDDE